MKTLTTLFAVTALFVSVSAANAGDYCFKYQGPCQNFNGENFLIAALANYDNVSRAPLEDIRLAEMNEATDNLRLAYRAFSRAAAKRQVIKAIEELNLFRATGNERDLIASADSILLALKLEYRPIVVQRPVVVTKPVYVARPIHVQRPVIVQPYRPSTYNYGGTWGGYGGKTCGPSGCR